MSADKPDELTFTIPVKKEDEDKRPRGISAAEMMERTALKSLKSQLGISDRELTHQLDLRRNTAADILADQMTGMGSLTAADRDLKAITEGLMSAASAYRQHTDLMSNFRVTAAESLLKDWKWMHTDFLSAFKSIENRNMQIMPTRGGWNFETAISFLRVRTKQFRSRWIRLQW